MIQMVTSFHGIMGIVDICKIHSVISFHDVDGSGDT